MSAHTPDLVEVAQMFVDWDSIASEEFDTRHPGVVEEMRARKGPHWSTNDAFNSHCRDLFRAAIARATLQDGGGE